MQPPAAGHESNTNANRRLQKTSTSVDDATTSTTSIMLGTRIYYGPVQLVGQLDPSFLTHGPNFLSGQNSNMWFWVSLVYDWDYDKDTESGNGSVKHTPQEPEKAAEPAVTPHLPYKTGAPGNAPAAPAPTTGQEFDS